jgi:hypothetical protein
MGLPTKIPKRETAFCILFKVKDGVWTWMHVVDGARAEPAVVEVRREWDYEEAYRQWEQAPTLGELVQQPNLKKKIDEGARTKVL